MKSLLSKLFGDSELEAVLSENRQLRERQFKQVEYIRRKTNQLLLLMGTLPIRPEELDDDNLLGIDPIGTVAESFGQILEHEKQLNNELQIAHDEIRAIISSVGIGIVVVDSEMRIKMYNQRVKELFELAPEELTGQTCCQALCGSGQPPSYCTFERVMESRRTVHQPDWQQGNRHFDVIGTPVKDKFGDVTHVVLAYNDITLRIEYEQQLREREKIYLDLFENVGDMVQCVMPDGTFMFVNRAWREQLGYSADELAGLKVWNIIAPEHRKQCLEIFNSLVQGKQTEMVSTVFFSKDGREIPVEGHACSSRAQGKTIATFGMFRCRAVSVAPGSEG